MEIRGVDRRVVATNATDLCIGRLMEERGKVIGLSNPWRWRDVGSEHPVQDLIEVLLEGWQNDGTLVQLFGNNDSSIDVLPRRRLMQR